MNLRGQTDPQIISHLTTLLSNHGAGRLSPDDVHEVIALTNIRSLTRADKVRAGELLTKYRYQSDTGRFTA